MLGCVLVQLDNRRAHAAAPPQARAGGSHKPELVQAALDAAPAALACPLGTRPAFWPETWCLCEPCPTGRRRTHAQLRGNSTRAAAQSPCAA
jgi:hypothetical protein